MKLASLVTLLLLALLAGTLHADAILKINQPIRTLKVSNEQMRSAIVNAALAQQWQVTPEGENELSATYQKSDYMAKVAIRYAPTFYSIDYADSKRMRYDGRTIHPTYNKLIRALQAEIIKNLKTGNFATHASSDTPAEESGQEDELRTKLIKIKKLHEEGLITREEYDAKRRSILDSY